MKTLSAREIRKVWGAARELFKPKALFMPQGLEEYKAIPDPLQRELRLSNGREVFLTDQGLSVLRRTVSLLHQLDVSSGMAAYSDVSSACRQVLEDCFSDGVVPESGAEFLQLLTDRLEPEISTFTHVVPLFGIALDGIDAATLGSLTIRRPSQEWLRGLGAIYTDEHLKPALERTGPSYLWMIGAAQGTAVVSREQFVARCKLACGLLAITAASMYEGGAHDFRIGVITTPEEGHGQAVSLHWSDLNRNLSLHFNFVRSQPFAINVELQFRIAESPLGRVAIRVLEATNRTPLEAAWVRALFWYSDAHLDQTPVMRLLKYWSCAEAFFSTDRRSITESVSFGMAASLVFGGSRFVDPGEFDTLRKRLKKMYAQRSDATHQASHLHVRNKDVADLSQWIAWMLLRMLAFIAAGLDTPQRVLSTLHQRIGVDQLSPM